MMGDDMAILSGGMYGDPESQYTKTNPNVGISKIKAAGIGLEVIGGVMGVAGSLMGVKAQYNQFSENIKALREEKAYNIANYEQFIADQLASNKISFYESGLDYNMGTARDVIESNKSASTQDMNQMIRQYDTAIKSMKEKRKASEISGIFGAGTGTVGTVAKLFL